MRKAAVKTATRTAETEAAYRRRYAYIERCAAEDAKRRAIDENRRFDLADEAHVPDFTAVAAQFRLMEPQWDAATAKLYRAALSFVFSSDGGPLAQEAIELIYYENEDEEWRAQLAEDLRAARRRRKKLHPRNAQQKAKRFTRENMVRLIAELRSSPSRWSRPTENWFCAGVLAGLRPSEWRRAEIIGDGTALRMVNAKATNDRSHGTYRTLGLTGLTSDQLELVKEHIRTVRMYDSAGMYTKLYEGCRQLLRDAADRVFPRSVHHPSLYTARHMFAADAKSVFGRAEVAAMMGHASTETAGQHYAKRHTGTGSLAVDPSDADIEAVLARNPGEIPAPDVEADRAPSPRERE